MEGAPDPIAEQARRRRFEAIAAEAMEPLRRYLRRRTGPEAAADVLADTLLVAWRRFDDLPEQPLPYLYGVARMCLANYQRGERRQQRVAGKVATLDPPGEVVRPPEPTDPDVAAALSRLTDTEAELVRLWAWEELSPAQIAQVLGITPNAVSLRLHRAKQKLRDEIRKIQGGSGHVSSEGRQP